MEVARQFELSVSRRMWVPRYEAVPCTGWYGAVFPHPAPQPMRPGTGPRPIPDGIGPRRRPLERFERWRQRRRAVPRTRRYGAVSWSHANGNAGKTSGTSYTVTLGYTPSAGSLLVVGASVGNTSTLSITDNSSGPADSWTALFSAQKTWGSGGAYSFQAWATNITAGTAPTSVTVSQSGSSTAMMVSIDNYTGGPNPFVQDGSGAFTANSYASSVAVSFTTGSTAGDLLWSCEAVTGGLTSTTVASPFTMREQASSYWANSSDDGVSGGVAANTQQTATYTLSGSAWAFACIIGFQASAAAFQPDEDYWAWQPPGTADPTVTVWG